MLDKIFSTIIGFIIGYIIIISVKYSNIKYHGPNSNIIRKLVYKNNLGKCYKYVPKPCICPISYLK